MYYLYMLSNDKYISEEDPMRGLILVKSEHIQTLVNQALDRDKEQFPSFSIGTEPINFSEDYYILADE